MDRSPKQTNDLQTVSDLGTEVFHKTSGSIAILQSDAQTKHFGPPRTTLELRNRLRSIRLQGRAKEQTLLRDTFHRIADGGGAGDTSPSKSETVWVVGPAGSGKSKCTESSLRQYVTDSGGCFVTGKFDQFQDGSVPYSGLAEAFGDLLDLLLQHESKESLVFKLSSVLLPSEIRTVSDAFIPNLGLFLGVAGGNTESHDEPAAVPSVAQLKVAVRRFVQVVSKSFKPLVLFLDDLQFADDESIDVIQALLTDEQSESTMFVCSVRSEFNHEAHLDCLLPQQTVPIRALGATEINAILTELFVRSSDGIDTLEELSRVIQRKTNGNAYSVLQYIEHLYDRGYVKLHPTEGLQWDLDVIQDLTDVADNVADMLEAKVKRLSAICRMVLQVASSCLGYRFYAPLLEKIMTASGQSKAMFQKALASAEEAMLIERCSKPVVGGLFYKFAHDQVQKAASNTIPEDHSAKLHLTVGRIALAFHDKLGADEATVTETKLLAAQNLSLVSELIESEDEKAALVKLNVEMGKLLLAKCAFFKAGVLLRAASTQLEPGRLWNVEQYYDEAIDVFSTLAETETSLGEYDRCRAAVQTVLEHSRSTDDRLRVYLADVKNCIAETKYSQAVEAAGNYMHMLGAKRFPSKGSKRMLVREVLLSKMNLRGKSDEYIRSLPLIDDKPSVVTIMALLTNIVICGYWLSDSELMAISGLRMLRLTLKYGLSSEGLYGLGMFAMVESSLMRFESARRYASLAYSLWSTDAGMFRSKSLECQFRTAMPQFVTHLWLPLSDCLEEYAHAKVCGLEAGDYHNAFSAVVGSVVGNLYCKNQPLPLILEDIDAACVEYESSGVSQQIMILCPLWQFMLNLSGCAEGRPTRMDSGYAIDKMLSMNPDAETKANLDMWVLLNQFLLSYFFDVWDFVEAKIFDVEKFLRTTLGVAQLSVYRTQVILGMSALGMFERSRNRRYLRVAKRCKNVLKELDRFGSPNAKSPLSVLQAEIAGVTKPKNSNAAESKLLEALAEARKAAWIDHYIVLARLVAFHHNRDEIKQRFYLEQLLSVCEDWGASSLTTHIIWKYDNVPLGKKRAGRDVPVHI